MESRLSTVENKYYADCVCSLRKFSERELNDRIKAVVQMKMDYGFYHYKEFTQIDGNNHQVYYLVLLVYSRNLIHKDMAFVWFVFL